MCVCVCVMKRIFGQAKEKAPPPSLSDASTTIEKRGTVLDEKIRKLDMELNRHREQMKKVKGPAQQAVKQRALRVLKQKRLYESQRDTLYSQQYNIDQISFTSEQIQDSVTTVQAMKAATTGMKKQFKAKELNIDNIDKMTDEMADLMDQAGEINEALAANYNLPDEIDEDELMGELDALEAELSLETSETEGAAAVPSYLQEPDPLPEVPMPGTEQTTAIEPEMQTAPQLEEA